MQPERKQPNLNEDDRPIWGCRAIGAEVNKPQRQTFYLLEKGLIPAKKIGDQWVTTRRALRAALDPTVIGEVA